jgi:glycosyltransferase involved in cell wall biosynthesis
VKIAVVSSNVFPCPPPGYSGLEAIAWHCADGLAKKGHEVALIAPEGSKLDNGTVIPTGPPGQWNERMGFSCYQNELSKFDAIIDHSWAKYSYLLKASGQLKAPVLGVLHAPVNTMYQTLPPVDKPCFVCISKDQASHFEALHSRPARVCYNGVDINFYRPMSIPRTDRFLFLARFSSIKGADIAIEACRQAGVGLDLVGDTSITNEPQYFETCKSLCDGKQIRMVGPARRGECVYWYSQAYAMLHPNQRFREPFGLAPVEAMLCGCPVVAWNYGAMKETIAGRGGVLVNSLEEMVKWIKTMSNPEPLQVALNDKTRWDVRDWASQFSVDNMVSGYEKLCQEAVEGGW